MSHVRSSFWIPHLRCLSTSIIRNCYGCKKSRSLPYYSPKPRTLPKDRTEKCFPFEVMVTGSAGPIYHKTKKKSEFKAYILLFSCSVTRAVEIKLVFNFTTTEFIKGFYETDFEGDANFADAAPHESESETVKKRQTI